MGFLADVGRSNLLGQVMQYGQFVRQGEVARRQNELLDMNINQKKQEVEAQKKETERLSQPFNIKLSPYLSVFEPGTPEYQKLFNTLRQGAGADEFGNTTIGGYEKGKQTLAADKEQMTILKEQKLGLLYDEYLKMKTKFDTAKISGDMEAVNKLQPTINALEAKIAMGEKKFADYLKLGQEKPDKPNMIELRRRALAGDPEAQAVLNADEESKVRIAREGRIAFAETRAVQVLDTYDQNRPVTLSLADVKRAPADRYVSASGGQKSLNKLALIEDIKGNIENTRQSITALKEDFTPAQAAQIAAVLKSRDPRNAFSQFMGSQFAATLSPPQVEYVTDILQLVENAYAMRSILGAGQGSDELRAAIRATIPGPQTPSKAYALKQLDKFNQVLNRLERGVPKVPLRKPEGPIHTNAETDTDLSGLSDEELLKMVGD